MTVKTFANTYVSKEENERQKAIAEKVAAEFTAEFQAMCERYKCEVSVREANASYTPYVEGIDVDFGGIYEDGTTVRPYFTISFGSNMT